MRTHRVKNWFYSNYIQIGCVNCKHYLLKESCGNALHRWADVSSWTDSGIRNHPQPWEWGKRKNGDFHLASAFLCQNIGQNRGFIERWATWVRHAFRAYPKGKRNIPRAFHSTGAILRQLKNTLIHPESAYFLYDAPARMWHSGKAMSIGLEKTFDKINVRLPNAQNIKRRYCQYMLW